MLKLHTNATANPPKGSKGKVSGAKQLSLWGVTARTISKTAKSLNEHSLRDITPLWTAAAKNLDLSAVQAIENKCQGLAVSISNGAANTHGKIRSMGLNYPADVAAYLVLRELDDKGRREVPEHRLKVIDLGMSALVRR